MGLKRFFGQSKDKGLDVSADLDLRQLVESALSQVIDPVSGGDLISNQSVNDLKEDEGQVYISIVLGYPSNSVSDTLSRAISERVAALQGVQSIDINISHKIRPHKYKADIDGIPGVKNVILVASGKGGVGKSTTAVNIALALKAEGTKVGLLDADIYGPSQDLMLGAQNVTPEANESTGIRPVTRHGIPSMSIGYLIDADQPVIWRGPMATRALEQLARDTEWVDLDYLIVDMPPGTGDVHLTTAQKIPVSGALIVTTPQDIALLDAIKGLKMFEKLNIPVLGVVENMSTHICSQCGHEEHIFGAGGGERMAKDTNVPLLGALPLDRRIREQADGGEPTVQAEPDGAIAQIYREIALRAVARLALEPELSSDSPINVAVN